MINAKITKMDENGHKSTTSKWHKCEHAQLLKMHYFQNDNISKMLKGQITKMPKMPEY